MKRLVVGLLAHVDSGKTTLAEGLLYRAGVLRKLGRVDHRDAFLDTDSRERARGITIFAKQAVLALPAAAGAEVCELTLLDTPGHVDFSAEMERVLQVLDYAVLGLGFNVVAPAEGWPAELQSVAGALFDGDPAPGARAALAAAFLNEFWPLYRTGPRSGYLDEYRSRLALAGHRVLVTPRSGTPRPAAVLGIDDECRLVVRYDGESRPAALTSGEAGVRLL